MKYSTYEKWILVIVIIILIVFVILLTKPLYPLALQQINTSPAPQFIYCTMLLAILNFFWSPFIYFMGKNDKLNDKLITFREELLSKKIIIPICVEPLTAFIEKEASNIHRLHALNVSFEAKSIKYNEYIRYFQREKSKIINKFMIIGSIDNQIYKFISEEIDQLEDIVVEYCGLNLIDDKAGSAAQRGRKYDEARKVLYDTYSKILSHFISHYDRVIIKG